MAYSSVSGKLPSESASKLGHLEILNSKWVQALVNDFEYVIQDTDSDPCDTQWFPVVDAEPLQNIWAVDGSFVKINSGSHPAKEVAFVKTALLMVDKQKLESIDRTTPHPLHMKGIMDDSALFHATVFPLNNIRTSKGTNYDAVRNIIFESMKNDENGAYFESYKWLIFKKWTNSKSNSPEFICPHCLSDVVNGFCFDEETMPCPSCGKEILLSDIMGFHLDMLEDCAPESIASAYMLIMETLMLFTPIRIFWSYSDLKLISNTLFIKDGPLSLSSQYVKLVPNIRAFLQFAKDQNRPIHIIGCEKSGKFFDHLSSIERFAPPKERDQSPSYCVLSHKYIVDEVQRRPSTKNQYGSRTNWGEKLYYKMEPGTFMVLNIPTGDYSASDEFPKAENLIGINRILATIPSLISRKYEGALFPVELANGISSLSNYPSSKILERYMDATNKK